MMAPLQGKDDDDSGSPKSPWGAGGHPQTSMFFICSSSTWSRPPPAFFLPLPSCCFFCFLESSCSMGAGLTNGISSRRSEKTRDACHLPTSRPRSRG